MKKIYITIMILIMGLCACAQCDGFFGNSGDSYVNRGSDDASALIMPRPEVGSHENDTVPLGSGLLIMTTLGAGYMLARKKRIVK